MAGEYLSLEEQQSEAGRRLHERIAYWEPQIAEADNDWFAKNAGQALRELNGLLEENGVLHTVCLVSGEGQWSELVISAGNAEEDVEEVEEVESNVLDPKNVPSEGRVAPRTHIRERFDNIEGLCRGFVINILDDRDRPELLCLFELETIEANVSRSMSVRYNPELYALPATMEVLVTNTYEAESVPEPVDYPELLHYSDGLNRMFGDMAFKRSSRELQAQLVDQHIEKAAKVSHAVGYEMIFESEFVYRPRTHEGSLVYEKVDVSKFILGGVCLGLAMTGRELLDHTAIRRKADLPLNKSNGISLIVELDSDDDIIDEMSIDCPIGSGEIVHVPLSSQLVEATWDDEVDPGFTP